MTEEASASPDGTQMDGVDTTNFHINLLIYDSVDKME